MGANVKYVCCVWTIKTRDATMRAIPYTGRMVVSGIEIKVTFTAFSLSVARETAGQLYELCSHLVTLIF